MRRPIIVVGAGFGGLFAARRLARRGANVTVVDRRNFHTFTPLLYQVAAAELEPEEIAYPVRTIFRGRKNVRMVLGDVQGLDLQARTIQVDERVLEFEDLILATGSTTSFFGVPGAAAGVPRALPRPALPGRGHDRGRRPGGGPLHDDVHRG
jgi:NADH dehydrogenase